MSTSPQPSTAPAPSPEPLGPKEVIQPAGSRRRLAGIALLLAVVIAAAAYYLWPRRKVETRAVAAPVIRTARVGKGMLHRTMRLTGTTVAGRFANIAAPLLRGPESGRALVLMSLIKSGATAKKGEVVAQIDGQAAKDHIEDVNATIQTAESDIKKRKADQAIEDESMRQALTQVKARLDKAKLEVGAAEVRTPIDQELMKLSVEEYEAEYKEQLTDIHTNEVSNLAELRILELTRDRHIRHRDRHLGDLKKFTIRAPMDGLAVMQTIFRGGDMGQIQEGDQVAPNQLFMKIVDPKSMQVEARINQVESEFIRIGQPASVKFDAFPDIQLKARVVSIGALAVGGWRMNYYIRAVPVKLELLEQDMRVIPDLSASADVVAETKPEAVLVPLEAVQTEGGAQVVYVKTANGFARREVKLGLRNNIQTEVVEGLQAGEEVALQRPATQRA